MCLNIVNQVLDYTEEQIGWKVFDTIRLEGVRRRLLPLIRTDAPEFEENKWITDPDNRMLNTDGGSDVYRTGYHILTSKSDAEEYKSRYEFVPTTVIRKVKYKGRVTIGIQGVFTCVVAKEMFIMDEKVEENVSV